MSLIFYALWRGGVDEGVSVGVGVSGVEGSRVSVGCGVSVGVTGDGVSVGMDVTVGSGVGVLDGVGVGFKAFSTLSCM